MIASAGSQVNLSASASDPDNDSLRMAWAKSAGSGSTWLFGAMLNTLFPNPSGSSVSFTAPSLARTAIASYDASVSDGRGGGAHGSNFVTVSPAPAPGQPPTGTLTVSPTDAPAGSTITVSFPATDPEGGSVSWDMWIGQKSGASGSCCFSGSSTTVTLNDAGVYRIGTQAIDKELNLSSRQSAVVRIGGATGAVTGLATTPPAGAAYYHPYPGYYGGGYPQQGYAGGYPEQGYAGGYPQQDYAGAYPQQGYAGGYPEQGDAGGYPRQEYYRGYGAPAPGAYAPPPYDY